MRRARCVQKALQSHVTAGGTPTVPSSACLNAQINLLHGLGMASCPSMPAHKAKQCVCWHLHCPHHQ